MIRMRTDFFSPALGMSTSAVILYPQDADGQIGMDGDVARDADGTPRIPVLYLLHGLSDDCTIWERRTSIERYATRRGLCVVMPEVRRSFYADEILGEKYWTFVSEELPQLLASTFRVSTAREDTYVAGLSMGGFGAMKLALNHPERFAAAGSFSGALDLRSRDLSEFTPVLPARIWGAGVTAPSLGLEVPATIEQALAPEDDLVARLRQADSRSLPKLWVGCGDEDFLLEENHSFIRELESKGADFYSVITPGFGHQWELWDGYVEEFISWIP